MDVLLRVAAADETESVAALASWLGAERDLQGAVRLVRSDPRDGELGGTLDVLTVALGSGGAGVVLAQSLSAWLRSRRVKVTLTISADGRKLTFEGSSQADALPLITEFLRSEDSNEGG
jgi:Effector Associated Constant Component 1